LGDFGKIDWNNGEVDITHLASKVWFGSGGTPKLSIEGSTGDLFTAGSIDMMEFQAYMYDGDTLPISRLKQFASNDLRMRLTDETGTSLASAKAVFNYNPTFDGATFTDSNPLYLGTDSDSWLTFDPLLGLKIGSGVDILFGTDLAPTKYMRMYSASGRMKVTLPLLLDSVPHATTDLDKFLTVHSDTIKYCTGTELLGYIGGQAALTNPVTGTGTANTLTKFTGTSTVGNSSITDNGSLVTLTTPLLATSFQSSTNDVLFGNTSTTSEYIRLYYNGGAGYVSLRSNGTEVLKTTDNGVNALSGKPYLYNGGKYAVVADTATTVKATWEADDIRPATRKAIAGYVAANAAGGAVTSVTASSPLSSSGGATPDISLSGTINVLHGGTNLNYIAAGSVLAANSTDTYSAVTSTSGTKVLTNTAGTISWEEGSVQQVEVSLDNTTIKSMYETPYTLIAAPGAGRAIIIIPQQSIMKLNYVSSAFNTASMFFYYNGGVANINWMASVTGTSIDHGGSGIFAISEANEGDPAYSENTSVKVTFSSDITTGGGSIDLYIAYRIITL
jgi:hypothetical protein